MREFPHGVKLDNGYVTIPNGHPFFTGLTNDQGRCPVEGGVIVNAEELTAAQLDQLGISGAPPVADAPADPAPEAAPEAEQGA